jgi:hypothetical protein
MSDLKKDLAAHEESIKRYYSSFNKEHELNLAKIQTLDFQLSKDSPRVFHPAIIFYPEVRINYDDVKEYGIKIQGYDWTSYGGKYLEKLPHGEYDFNIRCQFTVKSLKKALEDNKDQLLLYWRDEQKFCIPLTPQEVEKIIERVKAAEKEIDEENKRMDDYNRECVQINLQMKRDYNEKMNTLREQRQKQFENQENAV